MRKLLAALALALLAHDASAAEALVDKQVRLKKSVERGSGLRSGVVNALWPEFENVSPEYTISFNEGAAKGWAMLKYDGLAFSGTALVVNLGYAGPYKLGVTDGISSTIIPATEATGLDITSDASAANNDAVELFGGVVGASGRPFIIGTDPAFKFCVDTKIHDVSGSDGYYIGFRSVTTAAAAVTTYTDFATIANVSGDIKTVTDLANAGETTTTLVSSGWADDAEKTVCVLVSGAGVTTYTIDGSTDSDAVAYTFADGLLVIPFVYLIQDSDIADDTWIVSWQVAYQ